MFSDGYNLFDAVEFIAPEKYTGLKDLKGLH